MDAGRSGARLQKRDRWRMAPGFRLFGSFVRNEHFESFLSGTSEPLSTVGISTLESFLKKVPISFRWQQRRPNEARCEKDEAGTRAAHHGSFSFPLAFLAL